MRKSITTAGTALALSLALAGTAQADSITSSFSDFTNGSVDGQQGWKETGPYDQEIVGEAGNKALRISNARTSGSFADMPYSPPVAPAGENHDNNRLVSRFKISSASAQQQPGLSMSVSPTGDGGSRMSYLRFEDRFDGIRVFFTDATFTDK